MDTFNFSSLSGFQWDQGNIIKNRDKHNVTTGECEEVFFNEPYFVYNDERHSISENRFYVLGESGNERRLFIVFTIRNSFIRVISARDMHKNERKAYEKLKKNTKI